MQKPFIPWTRKECSTRRWLREPGFHAVSRPQGPYRLFHHLDGPRRPVPGLCPSPRDLPRPLLSPVKPSTKPSPNSPSRASPGSRLLALLDSVTGRAAMAFKLRRGVSC